MLDKFQQVLVRGGDEPDVNFHRLAAADRVYFAFLNSAQQLCLRVKRQVSNFIKEKRAAIRFDEFSGMFFDRPGERALLVAEKHAFNQIFGNCAAIDSNKWFPAALARTLNGARDNFFSDARLTLNYDRNVGLAGFLAKPKHPFHRRAFRNDIVECQHSRAGALDPLHLAFKRLNLQRVVNRDKQALG